MMPDLTSVSLINIHHIQHTCRASDLLSLTANGSGAQVDLYTYALFTCNCQVCVGDRKYVNRVCYV